MAAIRELIVLLNLDVVAPAPEQKRDATAPEGAEADSDSDPEDSFVLNDAQNGS